MLDAVARTLARTLADPQMRELVKTETAKKFDGDFDVLYANLAQKMVGSQTMAQKMEATKAGMESDLNFTFETLPGQLPLLNISVPVHLDTWDAGSYEPLVVISPSSFVKDEMKLTVVKAYDRHGKVHYLDAKKAPSVPVIVVGLNERVEVAKNGSYTLKKDLHTLPTPSFGTNMIPADDNGGGGGPIIGLPPGGGGSNCSFSDGQYEYIDYIYCENGDAWEGWFDGGPEFYLTIGGFNGNSGNPTAQSQVLGEGNNRFPFFGSEYTHFQALPEGKSFSHTPTVRWFNSYGEILTYIWREEDTGGVVDRNEVITVKWAGQVYSTNLLTQLRDNDDFVTKQPVYRQDCSPFRYGSPTFRWKVTRN